MTFEIRQGDTAPALIADLTYEDGTAANLAGATVHLRLYNPDATVQILDKACTVSGNTVTYTWGSADTGTAGDFVGEFFVTFSDASTRSFPTSGYFPVTILPKLSGATKPDPTWLTTADLIRQTRRFLDGHTAPARNKILSAIGPTDTEITFTYDSGIAEQTRISVGLETMHIWSVTGKTATVERGLDGTVPASHAAGDVALIGPEWTDAHILDALNEELRSLPSLGVYQLKALDFTLADYTEGYNLASDVLKVLDVSWQNISDATDWIPIAGYEVLRNMPTDVFPSGVGLTIPATRTPSETGAGWLWTWSRWGAPAWPQYTNAKIRVRYSAQFGSLSTLFDDVLTVTGLPASAQDILPLGAAIRAGAGRAIPRVAVGSQPDPRNSAEVRVSDVLNAWAGLRQEHDQRVKQEADRLAQQWVMRKPARRLATM